MVDSLHLVPGQLLPGTQSSHKVVEDVEVLLSPGEGTGDHMISESETAQVTRTNWGRTAHIERWDMQGEAPRVAQGTRDLTHMELKVMHD